MAHQQLQPQLLLTVTVRNAVKAYVPTMFTRVQLLQGMSRTIELDLAGTDDDTSIEEIGDGDDDWELLDDEEASDRDESPTAPRDITPPGPEQPTMLVDFCPRTELVSSQ